MKRQLILCPAISSNTFVLLYEKGEAGESWSIRDYSQQANVSVRYARDFPFTLQQLRAESLHALDAPVHPVGDLAFWHQLIQDTNGKYALRAPDSERLPSKCSLPSSSKEQKRFSVFALEHLLRLPKADKGSDMRRILHSKRSEDWLTWNAFMLAETFASDRWWRHLVSLAKEQNPKIDLPAGWQLSPILSLWQSVPAPKAYETASRARMRISEIESKVARSHRPAPVEGDSEIDISLRNDSLSIFIEAKLDADISARTSHDPERNQIVRNIDCLLDEPAQKALFFWMLVPRRDTQKAFWQVLEKYRNDPATLAEALPHRDPVALHKVAANFAVLEWKDFIEVVSRPADNPIAREVYDELNHRLR